ncbi:hypothetical protein, partial [Kitasatospora sp. NE20-6]|uniref:hypothetical protein n=1 Tax=Kitasatospora sp. NE20-6 TaxID=2859066 RepID=UPI0038B3DBDB
MPVFTARSGLCRSSLWVGPTLFAAFSLHGGRPPGRLSGRLSGRAAGWVGVARCRGSAEAFDDHGHALAAADAHGLQAV